MNDFTSHTQLELAQAIWRTLAYVDLFDYPLTAVEIHRYLEGIPASLAAVQHALAHSPQLAGQLLCHAGFYSLPGRSAVFAIRQQRQQQAQRLWSAARRYGALIARLPFVRLVAVTGSLAMSNVAAEADIDYFIVTENGRLWLARALVIGVVRLAARRGVVLCPNYFVAESALALPEHSLYTARELAQMVPLGWLPGLPAAAGAKQLGGLLFAQCRRPAAGNAHGWSLCVVGAKAGGTALADAVGQPVGAVGTSA